MFDVFENPVWDAETVFPRSPDRTVSDTGRTGCSDFHVDCVKIVKVTRKAPNAIKHSLRTFKNMSIVDPVHYLLGRVLMSMPSHSPEVDRFLSSLWVLMSGDTQYI